MCLKILQIKTKKEEEMGTFIQVLGIISIILGAISVATVVGFITGIGLIIGGLVYLTLGKTVNDVKKIKEKLGM